MKAATTAAALALAAAPACTTAQRIGALTASAMALSACDYSQTLAFSRDGEWGVPAPGGGYYVEKNPLLGKAPSPRTLTYVIVADEVALAGVGLVRIPAWMKYLVLGTVVAVEMANVAHTAPIAGVCGERHP